MAAYRRRTTAKAPYPKENEIVSDRPDSSRQHESSCKRRAPTTPHVDRGPVLSKNLSRTFES